MALKNTHADTEYRCHCGGYYDGCDHCPECGCEQYESQNCGVCPALLEVALDEALLDCQLWDNLGKGSRLQQFYVDQASKELSLQYGHARLVRKLTA